jgi:hypothetical protein
MRDFIHVDDVAGANVLAIGADLKGFVALNVCSGRPISIMEVATHSCEAREAGPPAVTCQYRSGDVRHIVADPTRRSSCSVSKPLSIRQRACVSSPSLGCEASRRTSKSLVDQRPIAENLERLAASIVAVLQGAVLVGSITGDMTPVGDAVNLAVDTLRRRLVGADPSESHDKSNPAMA